MRALASSVVTLVAVVLVAAGSGCSTIVRPTRPDRPLAQVDGALAGVRFDGAEVSIREPGLPLSPSRAWQREVANYTATSLNTLLGTSDTAPNARTVASFDLAAPSVIQIGTWKEMTIALITTLPDGTVVKSEPMSANIDDPLEYAGTTAMQVGGTVLDVTAGVATIAFVFLQEPTFGLVAIGALVGGLLFNVGQSGVQYVVAGAEETRWSNLYARALTAHAADIRKNIGKGPPKPAPTPPAPAAPPAASPAPAPAAQPTGPVDPSEPPPLLAPQNKPTQTKPLPIDPDEAVVDPAPPAGSGGASPKGTAP